MAACWPLQMPPTQKAVLISLADNANDQGDCWPSLATIAMRTCFGKTAVIAAIRWLEEHGAVVADRSNGRHTRYKVTPESFNLSASRTGPGGEPVREVDRLPVREANRSVSRTGPGGEPNLSASRTGPVRQADTNRKEPSRTVRKTRPKKITFDQWVKDLDDDYAIPPADPIFDWAEKAGIPDGYVELAWLAFADRFTGAEKTYADWRAAFRNYVKGGWLDLWKPSRDGGYYLTDAGLQWERVLEAESRAAA